MSEITVVVLGDPAAPVFRRLDALGPGVRIRIGKTAEDLRPEVAGAQVLFNWLGNRDQIRRVIELSRGLQWIHARYAGLDNLLFSELVESPIPLTNGSGVFSQSLGEFAILGVLWFAKHVPRLLKAKAEHKWEPFDVHEISKQTMGIYGHGDIGRAVAWRAKALGMKVLAVRRNTAPRPGDEHVDRVYPAAELHGMLAESDYVVVTAPLTPETRHAIGAAEFAAMKPEAIIMNVGRGPVIDETAMIEALRSGLIGGAALDVFETEPLSAGSPLWDMENVLISPHSADHTKDWVTDAADFFIEQFHRWKKGEPLRNVVDKRAGY